MPGGARILGFWREQPWKLKWFMQHELERKLSPRSRTTEPAATKAGIETRTVADEEIRSLAASHVVSFRHLPTLQLSFWRNVNIRQIVCDAMTEAFACLPYCSTGAFAAMRPSAHANYQLGSALRGRPRQSESDHSWVVRRSSRRRGVCWWPSQKKKSCCTDGQGQTIPSRWAADTLPASAPMFHSLVQIK